VMVPETGTVLIYTDGIVEARNHAGEEFGLLRLVEACAATNRGVDDLLTGITRAVRLWSGDCEQKDDMTMVALAAATE
jgi:serine phosphatase RsbU (regulator of sigma subunit)